MAQVESLVEFVFVGSAISDLSTDVDVKRRIALESLTFEGLKLSVWNNHSTGDVKTRLYKGIIVTIAIYASNKSKIEVFEVK